MEQQTRHQHFSMWLQGLDIPALAHHVREDISFSLRSLWDMGLRRPRDGRFVCEGLVSLPCPLHSVQPPAVISDAIAVGTPYGSALTLHRSPDLLVFSTNLRKELLLERDRKADG